MSVGSHEHDDESIEDLSDDALELVGAARDIKASFPAYMDGYGVIELWTVYQGIQRSTEAFRETFLRSAREQFADEDREELCRSLAEMAGLATIALEALMIDGNGNPIPATRILGLHGADD